MLFAVGSVALTGPLAARPAISTRTTVALMQQQPRKPSFDNLEKGVQVAQGLFEGMVKASQDAADNWVNSGWQVKKRAGQFVPEIRPNAIDVSERTTQWLPQASEVIDVAAADGAASSGLIDGRSGGSALTTPGDAALQVPLAYTRPAQGPGARVCTGRRWCRATHLGCGVAVACGWVRVDLNR